MLPRTRIQMLRVSSLERIDLPRCGAATRKRVAQTKGTKEKTGGSMWAPF
jgi:hypothetical protein